jgi:hypothetical protein
MAYYRNKKTGELWVQEKFGPPYVSTPVVIVVVAGLIAWGVFLAVFQPFFSVQPASPASSRPRRSQPKKSADSSGAHALDRKSEKQP